MEKMEIKRWWCLLLMVTVIWFWYFGVPQTPHKSGRRTLRRIHAKMAASGDWVTPRLNGLKCFEKPPLQYWATAATYTLLGGHHWTSRLWPALTGFAGFVIKVWLPGVRLFGREAERYAALILGSNLLYAVIGHINALDMGVTFFLTLGIVGLLLGQQAEADPHTRRNWLSAHG
ncbi:MAG: glycosyltransferase family 39 protein [Nitrosomonadales bacterium]|nr:glycosyltransferase family 39 protein [Nitrosomonadales bacterium]